MVFTATEISAMVNGFMWPFIRIGAVFVAVPFFGTRLVSVRIRVMLSLLLTLMLLPVLPEAPMIDPVSAEGVLVGLQQVLIGVSMGFVLQMVFNTIVVAGEAMATTMGLGFASIIDPQNGVNVPVVSQLLMMLGLLVFLSMDGHLLLIDLLADSFRWLPVGAGSIDGDGLWLLVGWASQMFANAVRLAMPVVVALLVIYLALGVMTRAAPQLNVFSVGFPITLLAGFVFLLLSLPSILPGFVGVIDAGMALLGRILGGG